MKRSKLLLVLVLALVAVMALVACDKTPVHEHAYGGWTIETAPTASAEGTATRKCACGEKETATLASLSDTSVWTVSNNVPATHTQDGCTVYTSQYGTVVVTLGKLTDHKYGAWEITVEPDLTTAGKAKRTCECGDIDEVDVPALENASVWTAATVVRASHDEEGLVRYTSVYGTVEKTVAKGEHSWSSWKIVTAPTATEKGEAARFCTTDGCKSTETAELPVLTDTTAWTASVAAATCTTPEITTYTSDYGTVTVETAAANGHNFQVSAIVTEPTCTEKGSATIKCTVCDCEETKEIAALGHEFSGAFVPYIVSAMEGEDGETWGTDYDGSEYHAQKCSRCGEYDAANKQPHTYEGAEVVFTSHENGGYHQVSATHACTVCGYNATFDKNWGNLEGWTKGDTVAATYTSAGYTEYTTEKDGVTYTYRLPIAKLVAPYDGKTYGVIEIDGATDPDEIPDRVINGYARSAHVTLDETGKGTGVGGYPFNGNVSVVMEDPATGKVKVISGNTNFTGYVDAETGIIVCARDASFDFVFLLTPYEENTNADNVKASVFAGTLAIDYSVNCEIGAKHSFSIFSTDNGVYFGVRFNNGTADISANECFEAENLVVFDKDGNKIKGFKKVDGTTTALDGYEGTYTNSADATESVVIDGIGGLVINGTVNGVYTKAADADYFEVYVVDGSGVKTAYYHVTISGDKYTKVAKNATVKFTSAEGTAPADATVFANIEYVLAPMADTETKKFMGWKRVGSEEYVTSVKPAIDEEINLEAVWADKVKINIVDSVGGNKTAYIGDGDTLSNILPAYETEKTVSSDKTKYFVCWYIDANGNGAFDAGEAIEAETEITTADNGITVVANWADSCVLAGTYYGQEVYNAGYGSYKANIAISVTGMISGKKTGKVIAYDATTGKVTWNEKKSDGTYKTEEYYFWYDAETEVIAGIYDDKNIGNDYYILSTANTETNYSVNEKFGVKNYADKDYYTIQFVNINTVVGARNILLYNNHIYSNIVISDAQGNALAISAIKEAKTLVVKDAASNEVIVSVAAVDAKFGTDSKTQALDEYFGTYTCEGQDNLVLDGVGNFTWGSKNGTYTLKDATAKTFDAYVVADGKNTEYYVITLDTTAKTYVAAEQKVTVTYTSTITPNEDISAVTVWKNVEFTLKTLTNADNMFRGWYVEGAEETLYNGAYIATADVTLIAKWDTKFTFTAVYNDGTTANLVKEYGEGDNVNVEKPVWKKHKFDGWFTTETFVAGTEWTSGTAITANVTVYAKWSDAEAYYNTYLPIGFSKTSANGGKENADVRNYGIISINADGVGTGTGYPFRGNVKIIDFNKTAGTMVISVDGTKYNAYMDNATGLIVMSQTKEDTTFAKVWLLSPFETSATVTSSASYWNSGKTRVIEYTFDGTTYKVFVHEGKVYFNVQFKSALTEGTDVAGENAYQAELLCVLDSEGNLLFKFAYDGTMMVALDGYEGKYTAANVGEVELDGVKTIKFGGNTGTYAKAEDGAGYTFDVYMTEGENTVYYELVVNKTGNTCTVTKVMVNVTFESSDVTADGGTPAAVNVNKNIAFTLPTLTNATMIFRGWYVLNDETKAIVPMNYVPTADVTLVAKWDEKVTLTIVYNNGLDNKTVVFGAGDALAMSSYEPVFTDGKVFDHWYLSDDGGATETAVFNDTTISADTTVYCAWKEAVKWYGDYIGGNVYGNDDKDRGGKSAKIDATGKVTGSVSGTINADGTAIVDGSSSRFMASDGNVIVCPYYNKPEVSTDFYFFAKADKGTQIHQYKHLGAANQVVVSYVKDGVTIYALVYGNEVFDNVSWTSSDGNTYAAKDLYNTKGTTLTFTNANGDVVKTIERA
mgnify:CR=1 FL=1